MAESTDERLRIARYLAEHGPTHGDRLAAALDMTLEEFWPQVNCPWFEIVVGGYDLTDEGRTQAGL